MLFSGGPHLRLAWVTPVLVVLAVGASVTAKLLADLSSGPFVALLMNSVGTVLLASAFEPRIPLDGNGGYWDSLKHAVREFPKYGSAPAFDIVRFYVGLALLLAGGLLSAVL